MRLTVRYPFVPKRKSFGTSLVMDAFGVQFDQGDHVVCENLVLKIEPGQLVLFTGPSGSGKSSLLRAVGDQLQQDGHNTLVDIATLILPDQPLVDALPLEVKESLDLLAACGLSEAQLLVRTPSELSEGQRYRFRLALGLAHLVKRGAGTDGWLIADEFTATLDRTLAQVLAFNLSRLARRQGMGCLLATTHEDVAGDLDADVCVRPDLDGRIMVEVFSSPPDSPSPPAPLPITGEGRRRRVSFFPAVGTVRAPVLTGATLPVGIIGATPSASSSGSPCSGMATSPSASASSVRRPGVCGCDIVTSESADDATRSG